MCAKKNNDVYPAYTEGLNLPYSLEAERAVLGSILIESKTINEVADKLKAEHFYLPEHQAIYRVMIAKMMNNEVIDIVTVLDALKSDGFFSGEEGKGYLLKLAQSVPSIGNVGRYATIVREQADIRRLIGAARSILDDAMDGSEDFNVLLDSAEQRVYDIRQGRYEGGLTPIADTIASNYEKYNSMSNPEERALLVGIPTGLETLDRITTGLNRSDLIVVGARPGVGKSTFLLNVARNVAVEQHRTVAVFNLEMSKEQMVNRMLSSEARVSGKQLRIGNLTPAEWNRIAAAASVLSSAPIYLDDTPGVTAQEMKARLRRIPNLGAVFIDYLQLMHSAVRIDNRVQEVSEITRSLKILAKELNVPIVVCAQLTRASEKQRRPSLVDLRESGSIEQDADQVLFLYREEMHIDQMDDPSTVEIGTGEIIVGKNRHGELGSVKMNFSGEFTKFSDRTPEQQAEDAAHDRA